MATPEETLDIEETETVVADTEDLGGDEDGIEVDRGEDRGGDPGEYDFDDEEPHAADEADEQPDAEDAKDDDGLGDMQARAKQAGWNDDELKDLAPELLRKIVEKLPQPAAKTDAPKVDEAKADDELDLDLDPEVFDEQVVGAFNKIKDHFGQKIKGLQSELESYKSTVSAVQQREFETTMDTLFNDAGRASSEAVKLFGSAAVRELGDAAPEFKNRVKLIEEMNVIAEGCKGTGKAIPPPQELFKKALAAAFPQVAASATKPRPPRRDSFIARPGGKKGKPLTGEALAMANARKFFQDNGLDGLE